MDRPTLQQLAYLVAVADHRHFGRAAEACFVSQPALSAQLRELERRLGATLVERSPRNVRLTPVGEATVARARSILAATDELVEQASQAGDELVGTTVLAAIPTMAPYLLGRLVPIVTNRFPRVELQIRELRTPDLVRAVRDGQVDVGLLALPVEGGDLRTATLGTDPFLLAFPTSHALARSSAPIPVGDLAAQRVLLLEDGHCLRDQALAVCDLAGTAPTDLRATSLPTLVQMVAAGLGVTLLPASAAGVEARPGNGITTRRFEEPAPSRTVGLVWRASSPQGPSFEELARLARPALFPVR
jgi:LysR family hydrogen peroxide-inducible transcriptional activator